MQQLDNMLRKFFQASRKVRVGIYTGLFFLLLASGGFLVVDAKLQQLSDVKLEAQQLQLALQQAQTKIALLPALEQQQQKLMATLEQTLPSVTDTTMTVINSAAQTAHLAVQTVTPSADIAADHYTQTPVQISAVSDYQQLLAFLQQLRQPNLLLVPSAITINTVDTQLKIALTLNRYYEFTDLEQPFTMTTVIAPPSLETTSVVLQRNPFLPPTVHPWRTVVMTGYVTMPRKQLALLQLADGSMVAVAAGDSFSDYHTIIQQVTAHDVVLTQSLPTANGVRTVTQTINLPEAKSAP